MKKLNDIAEELNVKPASLRTNLYRWQKAGKIDVVSPAQPLPELVVVRIYELYGQQPPQQLQAAPEQAEQPESQQPDYRQMAKAVKAKKQQQVIEVAETEQPKHTDFGRKSLTNPNVRFATAIVPIAAQAAIYAALAGRVYSIGSEAMTAGVFVVGLLFEAVGLMIAMSLPAGKQVVILGIDYSSRSVWLTIFFAMQIIIDFSYIGLLGSYSDLIGRVVIGVSVPVTILAYNNLYLKD
jgi:hypothetical protein